MFSNIKKHAAKYNKYFFIWPNNFMNGYKTSIFFTQIRYIFAFVFLFQFTIANAQDTIYLPNDTVLWTTGSKIEFIANSFAETNNEGKIISGFIKETQYIWTKERLVKFKAGSKIQLDHIGNIVFGTLAENIKLRTEGGFVLFMMDKEILLNKKGKVIEGYAVRNIQSKVQDKTVLFKAGNFIRFDGKGTIRYGTIAERKHLFCTNGKNRTFKAGSILEFDEEFNVIVNDVTVR